jgi:hypothetical protein
MDVDDGIDFALVAWNAVINDIEIATEAHIHAPIRSRTPIEFFMTNLQNLVLLSYYNPIHSLQYIQPAHQQGDSSLSRLLLKNKCPFLAQ